VSIPSFDFFKLQNVLQLNVVLLAFE